MTATTRFTRGFRRFAIFSKISSSGLKSKRLAAHWSMKSVVAR
jgi:hypothetical protein